MRVQWLYPGFLTLTAAFCCAGPVQCIAADAVPQLAETIALESMPPQTRGDLFMARGQYVQAVDAYRQVSPMTAVVWNKLGIAWHHLSAFDEAKRDYERALLIRPNYPEAINNLGAADFVQGRYKDAIKLYRKAQKLMPHSAVIAANLGTAYFARGKYSSGLEAYQTAFRLDPSVFDADATQLIQGNTATRDRARQDYCLAELFAEAGDQARAIAFLRKALDDGFHDRNQLMQDTDFAKLRATPEFAQLMAEEKIR
jgi:tetratricopeptide (TPR) repeat protein